MTLPATPTWFATIRETYELGSDDEALLALCEQAYRRWAELAARIDQDGVMVPGRYDGVDRGAGSSARRHGRGGQVTDRTVRTDDEKVAAMEVGFAIELLGELIPGSEEFEQASASVIACCDAWFRAGVANREPAAS